VDADLPGILAIYNDAVEHSTAIWNETRVDLANRQAWLSERQSAGFPVLVARNDAGELLGFASYGTFRPWAAFKYSVEHSVYVHHAHRGHGYGPTLLKALIEKAREQGVHLMIGGIDADNKASIELHKRLGFVHAGTITQAGFKFGRWLDLAFYQLTLETPLDPVDG